MLPIKSQSILVIFRNFQIQIPHTAPDTNLFAVAKQRFPDMLILPIASYAKERHIAHLADTIITIKDNKPQPLPIISNQDLCLFPKSSSEWIMIDLFINQSLLILRGTP